MDVINVVSLALYAGCRFLVYVVVLIGHRFYLHPLSKYPGPAVAKLPDAYAGIYTLFGCLHLRTYLDLLQYGPVLRAGPNKLVFKSIEALRDIYNNDRVTKSHVYRLTVASGKPSLFNIIDRRHHREKRKLIGHAISDKSLRAFEPTLVEQIDIFLRQLLVASRQPRPVELVVTAALFFYLSRYPEAYRKLAQETRAAFQNGSEIRSGPQLHGCRYLRACIDEALRMTPPVAGTLWREPYANEFREEPFVVDGHVIPPGTQVGVSIYAIHHEPEYFPKPFLFRPEHWLESDPETLKRMNLAFCPFSTGPRGCAGKSTDICCLIGSRLTKYSSVAYMESSLVIAKTLWYFDFKIADGDVGRSGEGRAGRTDGRGRVDEFQIWDSFWSTHLGPNLVFEPRGELWREIEMKA
ncbi:cytochrome P450 [Apiospora aurea]|uniref:Cytochrome P450 n=1 Tax=Apiospora aurea TaxID=335848 RepID=A0ABR1QZB1_9PEZI